MLMMFINVKTFHDNMSVKQLLNMHIIRILIFSENLNHASSFLILISMMIAGSSTAIVAQLLHQNLSRYQFTDPKVYVSVSSSAFHHFQQKVKKIFRCI